MALMDTTLLRLITDTATLFDDVTEVVATGNGTTVTFVDAFNVNSGAESFDGCEIHFTSGANTGLSSRVTTTAPSTGTLTFTPARTSTAAADTAILVNRRNKGFRYQDYKRAVNRAVEEMQGIALLPVIETIGTAFDAEDGTIAVPATMLELHAVEMQGSDGIWRTVPKAHPRGGNGWTLEAADAAIRIEGDAAYKADGLQLRALGTKRQTALSADTDTTTFDSTALIHMAAAHLCLSKVGGDQRYANMAVSFERKAAVYMTRGRTLRTPGTGRSRA